MDLLCEVVKDEFYLTFIFPFCMVGRSNIDIDLTYTKLVWKHHFYFYFYRWTISQVCIELTCTLVWMIKSVTKNACNWQKPYQDLWHFPACSKIYDKETKWRAVEDICVLRNTWYMLHQFRRIRLCRIPLGILKKWMKNEWKCPQNKDNLRLLLPKSFKNHFGLK